MVLSLVGRSAFRGRSYTEGGEELSLREVSMWHPLENWTEGGN